MPSYCVLILGNSSQQLDHLLSSLFVAQPNLQKHQIYVVDNGIDVSVKKRWAVNYLKGDEDFNFAKNFNSGLKAVPKDSDVFFVSDQGLLLTSGGLDRLSSLAYADADIGLAGPALVGKTNETFNSYQSIGALYNPTRRSELEGKEGYNPTLNFLAVYLKRALIDKIVPIPENIVTYGYEDQYLCNKMVEVGFDWIIDPDVLMAFPEWDGLNAPATFYSSNLYRGGQVLDELNAYYHSQEPEDLNANEKRLCRHVRQSLLNAQKESSKITTEVLDIEGMSSPKGRHLLNNLCALPHTNYLEIGTWKGSTLISALYENQETILHAVAIDNWSRCGGPESEFHENRLKFLSKFPLQFYSEDSFSLDVKDKIKFPINIYFYDGDHTALSHERAFTYYHSVFADTFIAIIDDWNWEEVREGTLKAFEKLRFQILFEIVLPSRWNGDEKGWWDGYYLAVIQKS